MSRESYGWIGLGRMGEPMARHVAGSGDPLTVWNRTSRRAGAFAQSLGGAVRAAATPREVAERSTILFVMLAGPEAVEETAIGPDGFLAGLRPGALVVDMGTDGIEAVRALEAHVRERGASLLDAPVLGSQGPAVEGKLVVLAGGAAKDLERARPALERMSRAIVTGGPSAGQGQALKLAANLLLGHLLTGLAGAIGLARALEADPTALVTALETGLGSPYFGNKGRQMIEERWEPQFTLALARKDLRLIADAARKAGISWPPLDAVRALMDEAAARGWDELDGAVLVRLAAPQPPAGGAGG